MQVVEHQKNGFDPPAQKIGQDSGQGLDGRRLTSLQELPDFRTAIGQALFNCCNEVEQERGQMIVCFVQTQPTRR